jgi:hypothetical protein
VLNLLAEAINLARANTRPLLGDPASYRTSALRQKLPLAGTKFNFRSTPESRLNSEIATCPKSAKNGSVTTYSITLLARAAAYRNLTTKTG